MILSRLSSLQRNLTLADLGLAWIIFFSLNFPKVVPVGFMLLLLSLFRKRNMTSVFPSKNEILTHPITWFLIYYLLLVIGLIYSDNEEFGIVKLENKLTFLILPLMWRNLIISRSREQWKIIFIASVVISLSICELMALYSFTTNKLSTLENVFFGQQFTLLHRGYFACYLIIASVFLLDIIKQKVDIKYIIVLFYIYIGVIQSASKVGVLCMILVLMVYIIYFIVKQRLKIGWLLLFGFAVGFLLIFTIENPMKKRIEIALSSDSNVPLKNNKSIESNAARILMWNASLNVWKENFIIGTGTGDYNDELVAYNKSMNNLGVVKEELNSHNQFLNTAVQLGILGLSVLVFIFISSYYHSERSISHVLILMVFLLNFLVESFLETQAGIVLFCTLILLIFIHDKEGKTSKLSSV